METLLNFSGICFEVGQSKSGLAQSADVARNYFHYLKDQGLHLIDHGDALCPNKNSIVKIFTDSDLSLIEWDQYKSAYSKTLELLQGPYPLLNWGGDHSVALATVGAFTAINPHGYVIWIDAHADLNLPVHSSSGHFHGMPLSILLNLNGIKERSFNWLGEILNPQKLIYVGLRDLDPFEEETIKSLGIKTFDHKEIQNLGMEKVAQEILNLTKGHPLHISFDIDSVDPLFAPATGVPVRGGLTPNDLDVLAEKLFNKSNVNSIDIVEINPALANADQVERTYLIALNFLMAVFNNPHNNYLGDHHDCTGKRNQREQFTQG